MTASSATPVPQPQPSASSVTDHHELQVAPARAGGRPDPLEELGHVQDEPVLVGVVEEPVDLDFEAHGGPVDAPPVPTPGEVRAQRGDDAGRQG